MATRNRTTSSVAALFTILAGAAHAATFTVTTDADDGPGSLQQAMLDANALVGADTIEFAIPGPGPHEIQLVTPLPVIVDPVTIDALTQSGADCASWPPTLQIELDGSKLPAGTDGFRLAVGGSTVRGLVINGLEPGFPAAGTSAAIFVESDENTVECNILGTDVSGTIAGSDIANEFGVYIDGGDRNTVGGLSPAQRNLISNNEQDGIHLDGGSADNFIGANFIGANLAGSERLENGNSGVWIGDAPGTVIGDGDHSAGICDRSCNLISGNDDNGIEIRGDGGDGAVIQGNFIGVDISGTVALPNQDSGIIIDAGIGDGSGDHLVGGRSDPGLCSHACNLLSGNEEEGIRLDDRGIVRVTIEGNFIGTDNSGMQAIPNRDGIKATGAGHVIGGVGRGNLISGNERWGLELGFNDGWVLGNRIGTASDGKTPLGNGDHGLIVSESGKRVGGIQAGEGNVIAFNGGHGIFHNVNTGAASNEQNPFLGNRIYANGMQGINLCVIVDVFFCDDVTPNDPGDADEGANRVQNFPELSGANGDGEATLTVDYLVPSTTENSAYPLTIEFFLADADAEEGRTLIGRASYEAIDAGAPVSIPLAPLAAVADADRIVATATDAEGNTSEFSTSIAVIGSAQPNQIFADRFEDRLVR